MLFGDARDRVEDIVKALLPAGLEQQLGVDVGLRQPENSWMRADRSKRARPAVELASCRDRNARALRCLREPCQSGTSS
jgi:hypothetical protein